MRKDKGPGIFWTTILSLLAIWVVLAFVFPWIAMKIDNKPQPLPIPASAMVMYAMVLASGIFIYVTSDETRLAEFMKPLIALFEVPQTRSEGIVRTAVLLLIPLWAARVGYGFARPESGDAVGVRIQHPTLPTSFAKFENPLRELPPEQYEKALHEGRTLFVTNCRPCHGDWAGGDGPMARGLRLKPANFTDPGTIATVVEAYSFWRIREGGPGLPPTATPWDSAMPSWKDDLSEEQIWKIIAAEYDLAGVEPRKPEKLE